MGDYRKSGAKPMRPRAININWIHNKIIKVDEFIIARVHVKL